MITSLSNPHLKKIAKLKQRRYRDELGLTVVYGLRELRRAYRAGVQIDALYVCRDILADFGGDEAYREAASWGAALYEVSPEVFAKISFGDRREGLLGVCRIPEVVLTAEGLPSDPIVVVLDGLEKPGNIGAVLRSCDAAGVDLVIAADTKTDLYNPNVVRASTGTVFSIRVVQADRETAHDFLKGRSIRMIAATPAGSVRYDETDLAHGGVAFILGAEDAGLSDFWITRADLQAVIPMRGEADSLNVSVTAAILVYEALRQRKNKRPLA